MKTAMKCSRKNKIKNVNKTKRLNVNENTENDDKIFIIPLALQMCIHGNLYEEFSLHYLLFMLYFLL